MTAPVSGKPAPRSASSPASLENAARDFLKTLKTPCRLLVAYSGGGDSSGLLAALAESLKDDRSLNISLVAATVDHGLRPGSAEEARAVGALCKRFSIPHHILTWQGEKPKTGIQAAAREARYRLLGELAQEIGADLIVTAHTRDDQVETLAMRRARNPDARGGISEAVLYDRRIWVCRPFLHVRRADIRAYLAARRIDWVDDPSNENDVFERVRVRKAVAAEATLGSSSGNEHLDDGQGEIARFLLGNIVIHSARVAVLDLTHCRIENPAHLDAVRHLAALMGGRTHLPGGEITARIARFLASPDQHRLTAERVVFDRRKHLLYIGRERRSLPGVTIAPGETALWDNRFRIRNEGRDSVTIGARSKDAEGRPVIRDALPDGLPGAVRQRIAATEPILLEGCFNSLSLKPIIPQFDRFLPLATLEVANALAFLVGLDHFPRLPAG